MTTRTHGAVGSIFRVSLANNLERYLGLPCVVGHNKKPAFASLSDKVRNCILSWSSRLLSIGGKEVFIKSVLQAIPSYAMMCFLLPKSFCTDLEALLTRFWWQKSIEKWGIHWCTWASLCELKENGGLELRDLASLTLLCLQSRDGT